MQGVSGCSSSQPFCSPILPLLQVVQADTRVLDIPSVQQAVERALQVRLLVAV